MPTRPKQKMPDFVADALAARDLRDRYDARPPFQRNDYLGWIKQARKPETRQKRLDQMLDELRGGDRYMGMDWNAGDRAAD